MNFLDQLKKLDAEAKEGPWVFDSKVLNLTRFLMANTQAIIELVEACEESVDVCHDSCASWDRSSDCDCGYVARCDALSKLKGDV